VTAKTQTCVTIACDVCGEQMQGDFVYHFDSIADAQGAASGEEWFIAVDGRALCPDWNPKQTSHLKPALELLPTLSPDERDRLIGVYPQLGEGYYGDEDERAEALGLTR